MKALIISAITAVISLTAFASDPINEKVRQAFEKTFKNAENVKWFELKDAIEVTFRQSKIETRVTYDAEGNILQSIRYYDESYLPLFLRTKLEKKFYGMKIFGVTEVATEDQTTYHVVLEDAKIWLHVETDELGGVAVNKKMRKG